MPAKTDQYLASLFADSFKRELDADEAVWRSLPFFAAALGLAITILSFAVQTAPPLGARFWPVLIYLLIGFAILAFTWAFRWFFNVVRPRDYRYPPNDNQIREFADGLLDYHRALGLSGDTLDERVLEEIQAFMIAELASATTRNRENNHGKIEARSQVLLFLMIGFGFAFVGEATIFAGRALEQRRVLAASDGERSNAGREEDGNAASATATAVAAHTAPASDRERRGQTFPRAGDAEELGTASLSDNKPTAPKPAPARPAPPKPVIVHRNGEPKSPGKP